ncbi:MAG: tripartite tricarboxylate transporter substrate binding protein BugD [Proteobacteria bacterium]|nr:tripartite tricarboxylate transporter substrate binding protein BugD [Burkholderiales bacterium]
MVKSVALRLSKHALRNASVGVVALVWGGAAAAQEYPNRPVSLIVPFAAGGPTDTMGRLMAQQFQAFFKQTVLVENAPGAGGTIGVDKVVRAAPDGQTILLMHIGMATAPALYKRLPFDPNKDLEPIGQVADVPMTLLTRPTLVPATLKELIPYLKANGDKVTIANAGIGAASHLCGLLFMSTIGIDLTTVPYKGTAPAISDLVGGQVDLLCDQSTNTVSQIKAGRVKVIGTTSARRLTQLPNVPTLAEQGLSGFELGVWHGLYAPRGTPKPILDRLNQALLATIKDAGFRARLAEFGVETVSPELATPQGLRTHLAREIEKWSPIIRKAGIYAD